VPAHPGFFPNFFIVGAPRCGTTSLSKYLKDNPQVRFSFPKETHFFTSIYPNHPDVDIERDYVERFFRRPKRQQRSVGEGSVTYLYSPEAIAAIKELKPDARFIVMARNPMEMLPSYHGLLLFMLAEDAEDFAVAWALQETRALGRNIPRHCNDPRTLQYREVGQIGAYTERLIEIAGAENTLVLLYDDLIHDTLGVYKRALEFLGADYDGRTEFPRYWQGRVYRSRFLQEALYRTPRKVGGTREFLEKRAREGKSRRKGRGKSASKRLYQRAVTMNTRSASRPPLDPETRQLLRESFARDIERLGRIVGRDLSHWT